MTRHTHDPDVITTAAQFIAEQPGATAGIMKDHTARSDGTCAGCGVENRTPWPCILIHIARRAAKIRPRHASRSTNRATAEDTEDPPPARPPHAGEHTPRTDPTPQPCAPARPRLTSSRANRRAHNLTHPIYPAHRATAEDFTT